MTQWPNLMLTACKRCAGLPHSHSSLSLPPSISLASSPSLPLFSHPPFPLRPFCLLPPPSLLPLSSSSTLSLRQIVTRCKENR